MKKFILLFTVVLTANSAVIPDTRAQEAFQFLQTLVAPLVQNVAGNSGQTRGAPLPFSREEVKSFLQQLSSTDEVKQLASYLKTNNVDVRSLINLQHDLQQELLAGQPLSRDASPQQLARTLNNLTPVDVQNFHDIAAAKIASNPSYSRAVAPVHDPEFQRIVGNILNLDLVKNAYEAVQSVAVNSKS